MKHFFILFMTIISYSQDKCNDFYEGTFEYNNSMVTLIIEHKNGYQLEKSLKYNIINLNKIEKINDCEFILKLYHVIKEGDLPKSSKDYVVNTTIIKVDGSSFQTISKINSIDFEMKATFTKVSNDVSDEFKEILNRIK